MDMFTDNFAVLGARTVGPEGGSFTLVGPTAAGPEGAIRSPTPWVWALARTLVDGPQDLAAAHAVQDGLKLQAAPARKPAAFAGRAAPWGEYFAAVQALLRESPLPATDAALFHRIAPLGLGAHGGFDPARFTPAQAAEIQAGVNAARGLLLGLRGRQLVVDGWAYPPADLGDFGQDYLMRAGVALAGLAALPREEAVYLRAVPPSGGFNFTGDGYRLRLPGVVPADGFWSLTMYEATADGQFFLTPNPIGRYAIGDRTPGLVRGPNGELEIRIARSSPGPGQEANWLPAPAKGPFALTFRAYLPRAELLDGRWRLPALEAL
jgi:hypothetical protein